MARPTVASVPSAETAVRRYLTFLNDPAALIDNEQTAELRRQLASTTDVLERLHLHSRIHKLQQPDETELVAEFAAHAADYCHTEGIPAAALTALGVQAHVLRAAGLQPGRRAATPPPDPSELQLTAAPPRPTPSFDDVARTGRVTVLPPALTATRNGDLRQAKPAKHTT